ncbi:MAG: hypothetical protein AB1589_44790, partial [Cyanobacteriota bacterium]
MQPVTVSVDGNADTIKQTWRRILEADTLNEQSIRSVGRVSDWIKMIQNVEDLLANISEESRDFNTYNTAVDNLVGRIWSSDQALLDTTGSVTAPILYFLTRLKMGEERFRKLAPKEASPFTPLLKFEKDGVFPIGLQENGSFLFATVERLTEQELVKHLSTPPILIGLDKLDSFGAWLNQDSGELVGKFPKQRIDTRVRNLNLQILAGKIALARNLGIWIPVMSLGEVFHELERRTFNVGGFVSLLEVTSAALKQKRILANPLVSQTQIQLPSLDVISVEFDHSESIWYQDNPFHATHEISGEHTDKCIDPILDLQLINYSNVPCIVNEVFFRHYVTWSEVKAPRIYGLLESAHTYDIEVSFDKPISVYPLKPPLFIAP